MKKVFSPLLAGIAVLLLASLSSRAASGDQYWDAQFGAPGVSNNIYAVAVNGAMVYAAGAATAGSTTNAPLYLWDGKQWSVAAMFHGPPAMIISDLAFVGNMLYAAGSFTNVNGVTAGGLAQWNGTSWSSVGFSGVGYALAVSGNNLYVGGAYTNAGGATTTNIGYWDGSAWHALGNGLGAAGGSTSVRAMAISGGLVYAGGAFNNSGPLSATNLAFWNGSVWAALGGGVNGGVLALTFNGGNLYAGGIFTQAGTTPASDIAEWNGANWSALGSGLASGGVESIAVLNGAICVAGSFTSVGGISASNFAIWNGSSWSAAGGGLSAVGIRAVSTGTNLYVGGDFAAAGGIWANAIASWDGSQWRSLGTPGRINGVQNVVTALASDGTNLYAGGFFNLAGQTSANYIARFDGTCWHPLGAGLNNSVDAIAVSNNNVYAGGNFTETADGASILNYVGHWDGTNWNAMGTFGAGGLVYSLAVRSNGVYAAGTGYNGNSYGSAFFELWNGASWQNVLAFNPSNSLVDFYLNDTIGFNSMAFLGSNIFAGGHVTMSQDDPNVPPPNMVYTNCNNIMRFDGTYAWIMGTGLNSNTSSMAVLGTNLYVAGLFTNAGGVSANHIAMWNGSQWAAVGGGVTGSGTIFALIAMGNDLYAGGSFTNLGGVPASLIAKWDGTNWSALGSGLGGRSASVQGLAAVGSDLFVGGNFTSSGGKGANDLAHWNDQVNFNTPQLTNPMWLANGQFSTLLVGISGQSNIIQATTNLET